MTTKPATLRDDQPFQFTHGRETYRTHLSGAVERKVGHQWQRIDTGNPDWIGRIKLAAGKALLIIAMLLTTPISTTQTTDNGQKEQAE